MNELSRIENDCTHTIVQATECVLNWIISEE